MNKKSAIFSIALLLIIAVTSPVSALEVIIDSNGNMTFYNDGVLGDSDEVETKEVEKKSEEMNKRHQEELREAKKSDSEIVKKRQEKEKEQLKKEAELKRKKTVENSAREKQERPLKVVTPSEEKELRIKRENQEVKLEVRDKESGELNEVEEASPERLKVELLATPREDLSDDQLEEIGNRNAQTRKEERKQRIGEFVELKRAQSGEEDSLELKSRDTVAKIHQSVEISIDPDTNEMSIINPQGETVKVVHLPDQAIARMEELGSLENVPPGIEKKLELVTNEDGSVVYKMTVPKSRKFLGLFNREVETEVELNDETGLSTETEVKHGGFRGFLDSLTF